MFVGAPIFHVAPSHGWVNDPNGPLLYSGRYHLFYQHLGNSASWSWGLSWGHVSSSDLVHWTRHPPALNPTPHSFDSDGCFSGCAVVLPASEAAAAGLAGSDAAATSHAANALGTATPADPAASAAADGMLAAGVGAADGSLPVLLYTGVVLRPDRDPAVGPSSLAVSELCTERQLAAAAADPAGDPFLLQWRKLPGSWLPAPPPGLCLNCFRDPFILEQPSPSNGLTWRVMVGAGVRQPGTGLPCAGDTSSSTTAACAAGQHDTDCAGSEAIAGAEGAAVAGAGVAEYADPRKAGRGTALVYRSKELLSGWQYEGPLCTASRAEQGVVWECPVLARLPLQQQPAAGQGQSSRPGTGAAAAQASHSHVFSISCGPRGSVLPGCVYWLGRYADGKFDLAAAAGPTQLDLGDLLYAPNLLTVPMQDGSSRLLLWGWLSELPGHQQPAQQQGSRPVSYAGAISLPRQLLLSPEGHLLQQPLPELALLRAGPGWTTKQLQLEPCKPRHIGGDIPSSYFDLEVTLLPATPTNAPADTSTCSTSCLAGIVLPAWGATDSSSSSTVAVAGQGAVLLYDFASCELVLTVGPAVGAELLTLQGAAPADVLAQYTPAGLAAAQSGSCATACGAASRGLGEGVRQLRGKLRLAPGQPLQLRLLMDFSLLEVFCGDGQVLSTRLYRGVWVSSSSSSAAVVSGADGDGRSRACASSDASVALAGAAAAADGPGAADADGHTRQSNGTSSSSSSSAAAATEVGRGWALPSAQPLEYEAVAADNVVRGMAEMNGVYLLAVAGGVVACGVSMHAMGSAWKECDQKVRST